jgi:hypothetical protein
MRAESAEGLMDLKEQTKQFELCVIRMHSALPKNTESQVIGRQVLCSGTLADVHSRQGQYSHSGEHCGARHPGCTLHGDLSHTADDGSPAYVSTCTKARWRWSHRNILAPPM